MLLQPSSADSPLDPVLEPVRAVVVDDHENVRELVKLYLVRFYKDVVEAVGKAHNFKTAVELLRTTPVDIVFLDIDLGDGTGFDALDMLTKEQRENLQVIIISTQLERRYLKQAMQYGALAYLDKPLIGTEFTDAVDQAIANVRKTRSINVQLAALTKKSKRPEVSEQKNIVEMRLINHNQVRTIRLTVGDVLVAEAARNYCAILALDGTQYMPSLPLKHYADTLIADGCVRISKKHIVNPAHAKFILKPDADATIAVLPNGEEIAVEPAFVGDVQDFL